MRTRKRLGGKLVVINDKWAIDTTSKKGNPTTNAYRDLELKVFTDLSVPITLANSSEVLRNSILVQKYRELCDACTTFECYDVLNRIKKDIRQIIKLRNKVATAHVKENETTQEAEDRMGHEGRVELWRSNYEPINELFHAVRKRLNKPFEVDTSILTDDRQTMGEKKTLVTESLRVTSTELKSIDTDFTISPFLDLQVDIKEVIQQTTELQGYVSEMKEGLQTCFTEIMRKTGDIQKITSEGEKKSSALQLTLTNVIFRFKDLTRVLELVGIFDKKVKVFSFSKPLSDIVEFSDSLEQFIIQIEEEMKRTRDTFQSRKTKLEEILLAIEKEESHLLAEEREEEKLEAEEREREKKYKLEKTEREAIIVSKERIIGGYSERIGEMRRQYAALMDEKDKTFMDIKLMVGRLYAGTISEINRLKDFIKALSDLPEDKKNKESNELRTAILEIKEKLLKPDPVDPTTLVKDKPLSRPLTREEVSFIEKGLIKKNTLDQQLVTLKEAIDTSVAERTELVKELEALPGFSEKFILTKKAERLKAEIDKIYYSYSPEIQKLMSERVSLMDKIYNLIDRIKATARLESSEKDALLAKYGIEKDALLVKYDIINEELKDINKERIDALYEDMVETTNRLSRLKGGKRKTRRVKR